MNVVATHVPLDTREWVLSHGVGMVVILAVAAVLLWLSRLMVRRMQKKLESVESVTLEYDLRRNYTLTQALSYSLRVVVWTVTVLLLLGQFGISLGPLIAGAGIAGVALGFGAQSLVRDFLSGFFILLENQFGVGDIVEISAEGQLVTGNVEDLSLRTTSLRAFDGTLYVVPNGTVRYAGNKSKGWARVIVDIGVAYGEDLDRVRGILQELFDEMRQKEEFRGAFLSGPELLGVERFTDYEVVLRIVTETNPSQRFPLQRELHKRIKQRFDERGVEIPFPQRVVISKQEDSQGEAPGPKAGRRSRKPDPGSAD